TFPASLPGAYPAHKSSTVASGALRSRVVFFFVQELFMEIRSLFKVPTLPKVLTRPVAGVLCAVSVLVVAPALAREPGQQLKDREGRQTVVEEGQEQESEVTVREEEQSRNQQQ